MMTLLKMSKLLGHDYDSVGFVCWLFSVAAAAAVAVEGGSVETRKRKSLRSFEKSAAAVAGDVATAVAAVVAGIFAAAKGLEFSVVVGSTKPL